MRRSLLNSFSVLRGCPSRWYDLGFNTEGSSCSVFGRIRRGGKFILGFGLTSEQIEVCVRFGWAYTRSSGGGEL